MSEDSRGFEWKRKRLVDILNCLLNSFMPIDNVAFVEEIAFRLKVRSFIERT